MDMVVEEVVDKEANQGGGAGQQGVGQGVQ